MSSTQAALGGGCGRAGAGSHASVLQLTLKSASEPAQSTPLPVSLNTSLLSPPSYPQQSPEPAPWSSTRRSSGVDAYRVDNAQFPILTSHHLGNESTHPPFLERPDFSPATSSTPFLTAGPGFTDIKPAPSSHTQDDPLAFLNSPSSSGMQVDLATATPFTGSTSPSALSQVASPAPTQQATPPTSPESQPTQQLLVNKRRRLSAPKDPRAAKRLRSQRQGDDENLEALYKLLVPKSSGVVQKKDRLGVSTSLLLLLSFWVMIRMMLSVLYYARKWVQTQDDSKQHLTTLEQTGDCRSTSPSQQGDPMESSQNFLGLMVHWIKLSTWSQGRATTFIWNCPI